MNQASYDLARLARNGLITRRPHANTYNLTPDGLAFAHFYTKVHDRVLAPLIAAGQPQAPPQLHAALRTIDQLTADRIAQARLPRRSLTTVTIRLTRSSGLRPCPLTTAIHHPVGSGRTSQKSVAPKVPRFARVLAEALARH